MSDAATRAMSCRVCGHEVPVGRFCGWCGAVLTHSRGDGPDWLRVREYAAAPGENVLQPSIVSTMFPHLPDRSQGTFRVGLLLVVTMLVVCCTLQWYIAMVAIATFAPLLLLTIYVVDTGILGDVPRWVWALTVALGAVVGVGWALLTSAMLAESYSLGLGTEVPTAELVRIAILIPAGGLLSMQLPVVLVRLIRPPVRESLYGFVIGVLGATTFTVAATLSRILPQLGSGLLTGEQPVGDLLLEATVRGVTMPLVAASVGGLVGAGLWYSRRDGPDRHGRRILVGALGLLAGAAVYAIVGLIEAFRMPPSLQVLVHLALALVAVLALRVGLQLAMLHERQEATDPALPIACPDCGHVIPDLAFCPACGVAAQAASRASRAARRRDRPQPSTEAVAS